MRWYVNILNTCKSMMVTFELYVVMLKNRPKPFCYAIVDEVDSVLIDDGRNPLLISGEVICI